MNAHDWYVENRAAFVARALEPGEERTFIDHLVRCEECTAEVSRLERDLSWLPMGVSPVALRPGLVREIASQVLDRPRRPRWMPWAVAAATVVAAVAIGYRGERQRVGLEARLAAQQGELLALTDTLSVLRQAQQVLQARISLDGRQGGLLIFQEPVSHRWSVIVHGLPPAPAGNVYQFWFITETGMIRSVEVNANTARPAFLTLAMPPVASPVMGAALTVESAVNRSPEPQGPELAHVTF